MKYLIIIAILLCSTFSLFSQIIDINFFNEISLSQKIIKNDSIFTDLKFNLNSAISDTITTNEISIFTGKILKKNNVVNDSLIIETLENLPVTFSCPTDYFFDYFPEITNFKLLSSNIYPERKNSFLVKNSIIEMDSIRLGFFSIYTPDFTVKNEINQSMNMEFDIFTIAEKQVQLLSPKCDLVIMLTSVPKFIVKDICSKYQIDAVLSFDYKKTYHEFWNNKTDFCSVISSKGKFGQLRIKKANGKITKKWKLKKFK